MEGIAALLESSDTNSNCSQTAEPLDMHLWPLLNPVQQTLHNVHASVDYIWPDQILWSSFSLRSAEAQDQDNAHSLSPI